MRKRAWSLSTRATVLVTVAVTLAAVVVGSLTLAGVYSLAREENDAALAAYREMLVDHVNGHLAAVDRIGMGLAVRDVIKTGAPAALAPVLLRSANMNGEYVDGVIVSDLGGRVLSSSMRGVPSRLPVELRVSTEMSGTRFVWDGEADGRGVLWAISREPGPTVPRAVLLKVRTSFLEAMLAEVCASGPDRCALVVGADGAPVAMGSTPASGVVAVELEARGARAAGSAVVRRTDGELTGSYASVPSAPDLGWRVLVLDSGAYAMDRARRAVLPGVGVMALVAALSIGGVFVWSRRMLAPLRVFEKRAKEVASGRYVRPYRVESDDEVGRLTAAFNRLGVRLNSLQDMARLLAGGSDLGEVLDAVLAATSHILGTGDAAVLLLDEDRTSLDLARGHGLREADLHYRVPLDARSPVCDAVREQTPIEFRAPKDQLGRELYGLFAADEKRQGVAVPLLVGEEALGAVVVFAAGTRPLSEDQTESLRAFSSQAAVAVHTSRLFQKESAARAEAEMLRRVAELVASSNDLDTTLDSVAEETCGLLDLDGYFVAIRDRGELGLPPSPDPDREERVLEVWGRSSPGPDERGPIVLEGDEAAGCGLTDEPCSSLVLVPLVREHRVGAVLALGRESGGEPLSRRAVAFSDTIGKELSLGLENAALLAKARTRAANLETIFRISQAVSSSLQLSVVLNRVLDVVQKIFGADAVSLMSYESSKRIIATSMARGVSSREMLGLKVGPGEDVPGKVYSEGAAMSLRDLEDVDTDLARMAVSQGLRSMLAVPLLARGRSIGVLSVFAQEAGAFTGEDMELLLTFAAQAALAIDTAGMYGREHHVSSVLQSSILPETLPEISGIEAEAFYLPVSSDAEIGGDFYDLVPMPDGRIMVAIGDVCGKGVSAATKTSMIKHSKRGMVVAGMGPAACLAELNRLVAVTGDPADIVTMWVGFIDPAAGTLVYANGGHPPALLRRASDGSILRLEPTGPLLGALADTPYEEREVPIGLGDLLLTYTDGVTEARHGDSFFGEARVREVLERGESADDVVEHLLAAVGAFSGGTLRDDAAGLAVRLVDPAESARLPDTAKGRIPSRSTPAEHDATAGRGSGRRKAPRTTKKGRAT